MAALPLGRKQQDASAALFSLLPAPVVLPASPADDQMPAPAVGDRVWAAQIGERRYAARLCGELGLQTLADGVVTQVAVAASDTTPTPLAVEQLIDQPRLANTVVLADGARLTGIFTERRFARGEYVGVQLDPRQCIAFGEAACTGT